MGDGGKGDAVVKALELMKQNTGSYAGKPLKLFDVQAEWVRGFYGTLLPDGLRQYRRSLIFAPRKWGKTEFIAANSVWCLCGDGEPAPEVYAAAGDVKQARRIFDSAAYKIRNNKYLSSICKITESKSLIQNKKNGGILRVLSSDGSLAHSLNASAVFADELHVWKGRDLWDALTTGRSTREQPITVAITTAGVYDPESIAYQLYSHAKAVQANPSVDPGFLPLIFEAGPSPDWRDLNTYRPLYPLWTPSLESELLDLIKVAQAMPSEVSKLLAYHLNQWVQSVETWLDMSAWDKCGSVPISLSELSGQPCWGGLDLAVVSDMCALILVFRKGDGYAILPHFWVPEETARKREAKGITPSYTAWVRQGYMTLTPGDVIDYQAIRQHVLQIAKQYRLQGLAIDMLFQGQGVAQQLQSDGIKVVDFGQGWRSMTAPTLELERLVTSGHLHHGGNPILRWHANNACIKRDDAGNPKVSKAVSEGKVDALVATIMALGIAASSKNAPPPTLNGGKPLILRLPI